MPIPSRIALLVLLVLGCASCFSTSNVVHDESIRLSRVVRLPDRVVPQLEPYVGQVTSVLKAFGFQVTEETAEDASQLRMDFNPNAFNMTVRISLWYEGQELASGSAKNLGFGTLIARSAAVGNLANSALERFERALTQMRGRTRFVPSRTAESIPAE